MKGRVVKVKEKSVFFLLFFLSNFLSLNSTTIEWVVAQHDGIGLRAHVGGTEDRYLVKEISNNEFLFAIFDGHCGREVADYCAENFVKRFSEKDIRVNESISDYIARKIVQLDVDIYLNFAGEVASGSTLCAVYIDCNGPMLYCANLGDSRAVMAKRNYTVELSSDHKPINEKERIESAGGRVELLNGRLYTKNSTVGLLVARSLGDLFHKNFPIPFKSSPAEELAALEHPLSNRAEVRSFQLTENDEFFIIASDGLWDVVSSAFAVQFLQALLLQSISLKDCVEKLASYAREHGSKDDITILVGRIIHD